MPTPHRIGAAWTEVRHHLTALVLVEILAGALLIAVITPVLSKSLAWLIKRSGEIAVSNAQIADFLSSPGGIGAVLLLLGGAFFSFFLRGAAVLRVLAAEEPSGVALGRVLPAIHRLALLALRQGIGYLGVLLPLVALGALVIPPLLAGHDINYFLQVKPPRFWLAVGVAALLGIAGVALVFVLFLRWLHAVPVLLFEGRSARDCLRRSAELVRWA